MTIIILTHPPARISAIKGMVLSCVVNLSLTKSFTWKKKKRTKEGIKKKEVKWATILAAKGINVNSSCSHILIAELLPAPCMFFIHSESLRATFWNTEPRGGMTCREFDSFLRGDADELREQTCKILFIDTIRIHNRDKDSLEMNAPIFF